MQRSSSTARDSPEFLRSQWFQFVATGRFLRACGVGGAPSPGRFNSWDSCPGGLVTRVRVHPVSDGCSSDCRDHHDAKSVPDYRAVRQPTENSRVTRAVHEQSSRVRMLAFVLQ